MVSGLQDADGKELRLYSEEQIDQGKSMGDLLLNTATVDPADCKSIATAGLTTSIDSGAVAVAISESDEPRTVSAQSGSEGPDAVELLTGIEDRMEQCASFTVEALGQKATVKSEELEAQTDAEKTFATASTRNDDTSDMLMQVSGAQGRLLVVATKSGADLGDADRQELEDLVNEVLAKAGSEGSASASTEPSPTMTETEGKETGGTETGGMTETSTATVSPTEQMTDGTETTTGATPTP
ncbi:hypothetical protein [Sinomonas halotolerans]|uniref:Uncharacterized protein n=1 Tax=Sinomonas halotolerans TaxID=1644133 RepID=A0ABU9X1E6_9MICC